MEAGRPRDDQERADKAARMRERFVALVRRSDEQFDLAEAALLIAAEEYPELDITVYLERIDDLAARVRQRLAEGRTAATTDADEQAFHALHEVIFEEAGFRGDPIQQEYYPLYHPRNSFLNDVLDRKRGMPITLTMLYCEVARRAGLQAVGIALPGHFLAEFRGEHMSVLLDPYNGGTRIPDNDRAALPGEYLVPAPKKQILARILNNLKNAYRQKGEMPKALAAIERILVVSPSLEHVRDRGLILTQMNLPGAAWFDLKLYARLANGMADADAAGRLADKLWRDMGRLN